MHPELSKALEDPDRHEAAKAAIVWWEHGVAFPVLYEGRPDPEVSARLIMGASPHDLAPQLTRKEAVSWSEQEEFSDPLEWLWVTIQRKSGVDRLSKVTDLRISVIRWAERCLMDDRLRNALLCERDSGVAIGDAAAGRLIDRLDELETQDLVRDAVRATFVAAIQRSIKDEWSGEDRLIENPKWIHDLPEGCALLTRFTSMFVEGVEMRNCISSYAEDVHNGESLPFSIHDESGRSTLLITNMSIDQHVGFANSDPPESHRRIGREVLRIVTGS